MAVHLRITVRVEEAVRIVGKDVRNAPGIPQDLGMSI